MDFKFWEYEHVVIVCAPDSELGHLDRLAASCAEDRGWGMEFDRDNMRYRFVRLRDAIMFAIFCQVMIIDAPKLFWSLGKNY